MKTIGTVILALALVAGGFFWGRYTCPEQPAACRVDTLVVRDTVRDTLLVPHVRYIARTDTVFLEISRDTVRVEVEVPIERKVYETADYRAEIEGFRPRLVDMEIYRQTRYITQTETVRVSDSKRWGLGLQVGYGYHCTGFRPYIGIGIQYNVIRW